MKKKICLFLAFLLFATCVAAACGPSKRDDATTGSGTQKQDDRVNPNLEKRYFDGYTYTVYGLGPNEGGDWNVHDLLTPEENDTDAISDSIYRRNSFLEDTYGFSFDLVEADTRWPYNQYYALLMAGDGMFDDFCMNPSDACSLAAEGLLYNVNAMPYLELENGYWDPSIVQPLSVYGKLYCLTGAISIVPKEGIRAMYFNKTIAEDINLPNIYQLVYDQAWTFDKLFEFAARGTKDVNGNSKMDSGDVYGIQYQGSIGMLLFQGAGERSIIKNSDDEFIIGCDSVRATNVAQKIAGYLGSQKNDMWQSSWQEMLTRFNDEQALFYTEVMLHIKTMRGFDVDFGIIPTPKYNEEQENYSHWVNFGEMYVHTVPYDTEDPDRTAYILEATAVASEYYVLPAFYDVSLKNKWSRDDESQDMLDIIFSTYSLDLGNVYGFGQLFNYVDRAVSSNGNLATVLGALTSSTNLQIESVVNKFALLD